MTNLIVDASIAVKWVIEQKNSEQAEALLSSGESLVAPSLVLAETGNALWKYVIHKQIDRRQANHFQNIITQGLNQLVPMQQLHLDALQLAAELKHPVYDCFYLALAKQQRAPFITADERLFQLGTQETDLDMRKL